MKVQKLLNLPIQSEFYVVIFLFLVIIFISVFGNKGKVVPYQMSTSLSHHPYREGFSNDVEKKETKGNKSGLGIFEAEGLHAGTIDSVPVNDPVSKLEGSHTCVGKSPWSNSLGGLCVTPEAQHTFMTRGGNFS